jgi:hypothetical protein
MLIDPQLKNALPIQATAGVRAATLPNFRSDAVVVLGESLDEGSQLSRKCTTDYSAYCRISTSRSTAIERHRKILTLITSANAKAYFFFDYQHIMLTLIAGNSFLALPKGGLNVEPRNYPPVQT